MRGLKASLICAGLAVAAHAALLLRWDAPTGASSPQSKGALHTRLVREPVPSPVTADAVEVHEAPAAADHIDAAVEAAAASPKPTAASNEQEPDFEDGPPRIGFPDAPLPEQGVQLRAYVELAADGSTAQVSTASAPGAAVPPVGFQKLTESGLRQARFKPGLGPAYCLLVRFDPSAPAPKLAWLPGAAHDASRCLAGAQPAPRALDAPAH